MHAGSPFGPERTARRRWTLVLTAGFVGLAVAGLALLGYGARRNGAYPARWLDSPDPPERALAEMAEAFEAAQQFIVGQFNYDALRDVAWRDWQYEGHKGWYRFYGHVDATTRDGQTHHIYYEVAVSLEPSGAWKLEDVIVTERTAPTPGG